MTRKELFAIVFVVWFILIFAAFACTRSAGAGTSWRAATPQPTFAYNISGEAATTPYQPVTREPGAPVESPTPDPARVMPTLRVETEQYIVQRGDQLGRIAERYGVTITQLIEANDIANPDLIEPGQVLTIPPGQPRPPGPDFKVIPDSELVNGPAAAYFDLAGTIKSHNGYLNRYTQTVDGETRSGAQVVQRVAEEYSVNPRLLLAVLEYQSGWLTQSAPADESKEYPMQLFDASRKGLYRQLAWAANQLNRGYYLWRANSIPNWTLADGVIIPAAPTLNAGTAGIQSFFATLLDESHWTTAVTEAGLFATYTKLFGYPFDYAVEPFIPTGLTQPVMILPFEPGIPWYFTGGPHGGWASGSGWAAIDFAPPSDLLGCNQSNEWVTAVADGMVVRTGVGAVIQDLDGDGLEQTGWTVFYQHIETRDRVETGTMLRAGDRVGHPSCEGGYSTGTHVHIARRYNGEWIPADGSLPFNLDGWVSSGAGYEYDGYLVKDGVTIEALEGRKSENEITR